MHLWKMYMKILLETRMFGKNLSWFLGHFHVKVSILKSCFNDKTRSFFIRIRLPDVLLLEFKKSKGINACW